MNFDPQNRINIPDATVPGLSDAFHTAGLAFVSRSEQGGLFFYTDDPVAGAELIAAYNPLPFAKAAALTALGDKFKAVKAGGHVTSLGPSINTASSDITDLLMAYQIALADNTAVYILQDAGGTWRSLTAAQTKTLAGDIAAWQKALAARAQALFNQINAAATWQVVQAIDVTVGWPV